MPRGQIPSLKQSSVADYIPYASSEQEWEGSLKESEERVLQRNLEEQATNSMQEAKAVYLNGHY